MPEPITPPRAKPALEQALEECQLPLTYAPRLHAMLGSWERILELDLNRLHVGASILMAPGHATRFVQHVQRRQSPPASIMRSPTRKSRDEGDTDRFGKFDKRSADMPDDLSPVSSMSQFHPKAADGPLTCIAVMLAPLLKQFFPTSQLDHDR